VNARHREQRERQLRRFEALTRLNQLITSSLDLDQVLDEIVRAATELMGIPIVQMWYADEDARVLHLRALSSDAAAMGFRTTQFAYGVGAAGWIAVHHVPLQIRDVTIDDRFPRAGWWKTNGMTGYYGVPVLLEGHVLGVLSMFGRGPLDLGPHDLALLDALVAQAALAIRNAQHVERREQQLARRRVLTRLNQLISSTLDLDVVLQEIAKAASQLMSAPVAHFWIADGDARVLDLRASVQPVELPAFPSARFEFGEGATGWVAEQHEPLNVPDVGADGRFRHGDWWQAQGLRSYCSRRLRRSYASPSPTPASAWRSRRAIVCSSRSVRLIAQLPDGTAGPGWDSRSASDWWS
jgi:GAF domain-containing protein